MAERRIGDRYVLKKKILAGDPTRGIPDLWQANDVGDIYYIKLWTRRGADSDIKALWNREVRGLTRIQGYPGASEFFVRLYDLHAGDEYFYAVLDGGTRILLSTILAERARYPWLLNLAEVGRRRPLWEGLLRVAEALSILHGEGTLHRSLSPTSIFCAPDGKGEFRLSGFEWSLRIAGNEGAAKKVGRRGTLQAPELDRPEVEYSPATDWYDFGLVAAELFGVPVQTLKKRDLVRNAIAKLTNLRDSERELILRFLENDQEERLSQADGALQSLRDVVRDLANVSVGTGRPLVVAVRLGPDVSLSRAIEQASKRKAPADQPTTQQKWIHNDLRGDTRVTARLLPYPHFVLRGAQLEYRVRQWSIGGSSTWEIGFCESVETAPRSAVDDQHFSLGNRKLDVQTYPNVRKTQQQTRDRSAVWDKVFSFGRKRHQIDAHLRDVHDFFRVTQQLDTLLTAAQICPVEILEIDRSDSKTQIVVTPLEEAERTNLAQHLGLAPPSEQLRDWFRLGAEPVVADDEDDPDRDFYSLLERRTIASEGGSATWRFSEAKPHPDGPRYIFQCAGSALVRLGRSYLARNHGGTLAQIRRRHKAIEDLGSHEGLLKFLADPRSASRTISDQLPETESAISLDESKLKTLARIWKSEPAFAVQGPPGTGKTTLIEAFADRLFSADSSAQILITGHSHHTVDHVREKLDQLFLDASDTKKPILVRLGSKVVTAHGVAPITQGLLGRLNDSELAQRAPSFLKERIEAAYGDGSTRSEAADVDFRTMQILVQDAANLTFATSNSAELAELADRGRRFDWSVIEEAGKAHGFDMAAALQESHRLLLIGDHFQLPPFNARLFKNLLGDPLRVRKAIQSGAQFAPGLVEPSIVDEDDDRDPFADRCQRWREMVTLFAVIFNRSIGEDGESAGPAATLTDQHRMHPDIAELVGRIFYPTSDGGTILKSPPETHKRFSGPPPFETVSGSWLPEQRIVWCNVPWIQKVEYSEGESDGLFIAPAETKAIVRLLKQFRPRNNNPCEFQILSPYNDQLGDIRDAIEQERKKGLLKQMFSEPFDLRRDKRLGATVDEFQGDEADVVIVSLVRNNALVPWKSVGFLKEANRMDVLLSRARHKLIIVGSWDFFASRCDVHTPPDAEYAYLGRMMKLMERAVLDKRVARVEI